MSIENCPLTQIPTEIVGGGPSLVIQVELDTILTPRLICDICSSWSSKVPTEPCEMWSQNLQIIWY